jgi:transposase
MRKVREVLRLYLAMQMSARAIAQSCHLSPSTVSDYVGRAKVAHLSWPLPAELDDDGALQRLLFRDGSPAIARRPEPDWAQVHAELLRSRHVTKLLLWQEYREATPDGFGYSHFCERYASWARHLSATMRQVHRAGERMFVDFSGDGIPVHDGNEVVTATLFVAVLGSQQPHLRRAGPARESVCLDRLPRARIRILRWCS